jgi:hypothetical protein
VTYLPPPAGSFDVQWATQNNRVIQQELNRLGPLASRVAELETGKQPVDGDLTAIAALTGAGYLKRTGTDAWTLLATVPYSELSSIPAAIDAIDGLTPAADRLAYYTGAATAALATLTSFGRSLIDDANASAGRTTLGLGTAATQNTGTSGANVPLLNGANTWSANQSITGSLSASNTIRVDAANNHLVLYETDASAGNRYWTWQVNGETLQIQSRSDAGAFTANLFQLTRAGAASVNGTLTATGAISGSNLAGTTWTPTITAVTNVSGSLGAAGQYVRVGNTVAGSIRIPIISTSGAGSAQFDLSLPVSSSLALLGDVAGTLTAVDGSTILPGYLTADTSNDRMQCFFTAGAATNYALHITFAYSIK